ncbi:MAG: hydroxymethylbilane synthase [Candidatus Rifleibacteriota bacterium]
MKLKIGTRGSKLALHQTRQVAGLIKTHKPECEIEEVIIKTLGDRVKDMPLFKVGGQGLFIKEIENALLDGRIDIAVHSLKDVPHQIAEGLVLAGFGLAKDARDCFLSEKYSSLNQLPSGAIVGTSSLRRRSQIAAIRPDLVFSDFRGNLDTRLQKLKDGEVDAIVLAAAGLIRLGQAGKIGELFPIEKITPPAGQGLIAVQCRKEDYDKVTDHLKLFNCEVSKIRALCERAFLQEIQGGCQTPLAAHAMINGETVRLYTFVGTPDGAKTIRRCDCGSIHEPEALGKQAAMAIVSGGATEIIEAVRGKKRDE